jgi:hypothetical protein
MRRYSQGRQWGWRRNGVAAFVENKKVAAECVGSHGRGMMFVIALGETTGQIGERHDHIATFAVFEKGRIKNQ